MIHPNGPRTGRPPTIAPQGMVSTSHYLASAAGLRALQQGGSAVDAAIAANAVLCVVYPHMAGLGGDGFWLISGGAAEGVEALQASGPAARAATADYYREQGHTDAIPDRGPLAALTVPGAVDGWRLAHERHGRLPWEDLFTEAIRYARDGMPVARTLADWLAEDAPILRQYEESASVYLPGGEVLREGAKLVQANLAESLEVVSREGARKGYYEGELAERICRGIEAGGSPLRPEDFAAYEARWVEPITGSYRGFDIYQLPPSTQGVTALQILNLLEGMDVTSWGEGTADYYHHLVEAIKVAFADRDWITDPDFVDVPVQRLLSKEYAQERRQLIDPHRALNAEEIESGIPLEGVPSGGSAGGDTVYFAAADPDGMVVSIIQSPYYDFGSGAVAGDTGIIMQNRGSFFSLDEKHPNFLQPGKRTFHTIIPALMMRDGQPVMAYGTMGGEGQPQTQAALVTRLVDFGFNVQQAIEAPRWLMGRTWGTAVSSLNLEANMGDEVIRELTLRGQPVAITARWDGTLGHAQAIRVDRENGFLEGGADPRGDGAAGGY